MRIQLLCSVRVDMSVSWFRMQRRMSGKTTPTCSTLTIRSANIRHWWKATQLSRVMAWLMCFLPSRTGWGSVLHRRPLLWQHQPLHQPPLWSKPHPGARVHAAPGPEVPTHRLLQLQGHPQRSRTGVRCKRRPRFFFFFRIWYWSNIYKVFYPPQRTNIGLISVSSDIKGWDFCITSENTYCNIVTALITVQPENFSLERPPNS